MNETLKRVIYTLNKIPVSGEQNLDMMLGCIRVLEKLANEESDQDG